jgi:cell division protein ZapA (FtsZ GTPase activity inhibitor)
MLKQVSVSILGTTYALLTDEREELVQRAAHNLDLLLREKKVQQVAHHDKHIILVALTLATEQLKAHESLEKTVQHAAYLCSLVDQGL